MPAARVTQVAVEVLRGPQGPRISQAALEVLRTNSWGSRTSQVSVEVLRVSQNCRLTQSALEVLRENQQGSRISQAAVEALRSNSAGLRLSQEAVEVLRTNQRGSKVSQTAVEVLRTFAVGLRASQAAVEILRENKFPAYVTQLVGEVLRTGDAEARVTQLAAEILRTGDAKARLTQLVMEVLRTNAPLANPGAGALRPWPFRANAAYELIEEYGYLSEVLRARNGAEQRRALRETPSGRLSFTSTLLDLRELQYAATLLRTLIGQEIGVPLWQYSSRLSAFLPSGSEAIATDAGTIPWFEGGFGLLWQSPWAWEVFQVGSVAAESVGLAGATQAPWNAGSTLLMPLVPGSFEEREELSRLSPVAGDYPFDFLVSAFAPAAPAIAPAQTTYKGYDVLEIAPNRPGPVSEGTERALQILETQTGVRWADVLEAAAVGDRPFHWPCVGRAAALAQKRWLDARLGLVVPFWVPTWEPDLTLAASAQQYNPEIHIHRIEYAGLAWAGSNARRHLTVVVPGAASSYHSVVAAADSGGATETLTLVPAPSSAWPTTTRISFLRFCRLREASVRRAWRGGAFCDAEIPVVEIPKEAPAA